MEDSAYLVKRLLSWSLFATGRAHPACLVLDMFRVLFLRMTICFKSLWFGGQSLPSPNWESQEKTRMSALEQPWVCGQVGLAPSPSVTSVDTGHTVAQLQASGNASCRGAGNALLLQACPGRESRGAELCPPGSFSHSYWSDQSPALTWGEGARGGVPLIYVPAHGNMEWAWVFPQRKWQMLIVIYFYLLSIKVSFNHLGTYLYCKLVTGFYRAKECKWNKIEKALRTLLKISE